MKQNTTASNDNDINKMDRMITSNVKITIVVSNGLWSKPFINFATCVSVLFNNCL